MSSAEQEAKKALPAEVLQFHAPLLKERFLRLRTPFLTVSVAAMAFAVVSTLAFTLQVRLIGIAAFTVLLIATFLLYNPARARYDKWKHLDLLRLKEGSDGDVELEMEFHEAFRDEGVNILNDMSKAILKKDATELGLQAHKIKGSALTIGYPEIAKTSLRIETLGKGGKFENASDLFPKLREQIIFIDSLMQEYFKYRLEASKVDPKKVR